MAVAVSLVAACAATTVSAARPTTTTPDDLTEVEQITNYAGDDRAEYLYECAQEEGQVVYYTSSSVAKRLLEPAFEALYPGVDVEVFEATTDLVQRLVEEENAGRHNFDVYLDIYGNLERDAEYFARITSPNAEGLQPKLDQPYYKGINGFIMSVGYNPEIVTGDMVPTSYEQLADPKYEGMIQGGVDTTTPVTFGAMMAQYGEEFMEAFSQNVRVQEGVSSRGVADLVIAGEVPIAWGVSSGYHKSDFLDNGAPFRWVPMDPMVATYSTFSISANAPHPCAATLLLDWMLDRSETGGQTVWGDYGSPSPFADQPLLPFEVEGGGDPETWNVIFANDPALIEGFDSYLDAVATWEEEYRNMFLR